MTDAIEKVARALDLVPFLVKNQGISFKELASRFGIAEKELLEELNIIFCCGLPGYTPLELIDLSFDDGFVSVINPQVLDVPRKLSVTELLRLHLGLEVLRPYLSPEMSLEAEKLEEKIVGHLSGIPVVEVIPPKQSNEIKLINQAIREERNFSFSYVSANSDSKSTREVMPVFFRQSTNHLILEAREIDTGIIKSFRIDRISDVVLIDRLKGDLIQVNNEPSTSYTLHVDTRGYKFLSENQRFILETSETETGKVIILSGISENWLVAEIFAYRGSIKVLAPDYLKEAVKTEALKRLQQV